MNSIIAYIAYFLVASSLDITIPRQDINCLSRAVYHEARGEPVIGQMAVAHVVLNRVKSKSYPGEICDVVYQRSQFSGLNPYLKFKEDKAWKDAVEIAVLSYTGYLEDPTNGAQYYYANGGANRVNQPYWAEGMIVLAQIDNHIFLKGK